MCVKRNKEKGVVFIIGGLHSMVTSFNDFVSVREKGETSKHTHCKYSYPSQAYDKTSLPYQTW